jgi:hypothetical protein
LKNLTSEAEQRKILIKLLKQSDIFYDAQYKDATTVYNVIFFFFIFLETFHAIIYLMNTVASATSPIILYNTAINIAILY